jgi:murein L,D-transpeptidase YcbB/YkuD
MKIRSLALALMLAVAPSLGRAQEQPAAPPSGLRLDLNIPSNRLRVFDGDSLIRTYRVSVGLPGHDTPDGEFQVQRAEWNPSWTPPQREWAREKKFTPPGPNNPMGRVKLFFAPLYYIHGTPDSASVGQPASHGCVRMLNRDVIALARLLHERASPTVAPDEITGILARSRQTRWSTLRAPVPLTIRYEPVVVENGELRIYKDVYERRRIHTESLYQALLAAGYDASTLDRAQLRAVLARAAEAEGVYRVRVADAFGLRETLASHRGTETRR